MQQRIESHCGRAGHPIFGLLRDDGRQMTWLARQTGVSAQYVRAIKCGLQRPGARFRAECARVMGRPDSELFHGVLNGRDEPAETGLATPLYPTQEDAAISTVA